MKKIIQLIFCGLLSTVAIAQTNLERDISSEKLNTPERSETLKILYEQAKYLDYNGTSTEIDQNRLAIKNEWENIDPEIAALYNPIQISASEDDLNAVIQRRKPYPKSSPLTRKWADDLLIRDDFIDGIDMDVSPTGDIYIAAYENIIEQGGTDDEFYIYKSTDHGISFETLTIFDIDQVIQKIQIISLDNEDLLVYFLLEGGNFWGLYVDGSTGGSSGSVLNTGISDFSVDRNHPINPENTRIFGTFLKDESCTTQVFSARTTASSLGMEWVDEVDVYGLCGNQIDFAYGRDGATYITFLGYQSGNLYAGANNDFNDPASWNPYEIVEEGTEQESVNPVIKATRKVFADDEVMIFVQSRDEGSTSGYNHLRYAREAGSLYQMDQIGIVFNNQSIGPIDAWINKENNREIIQTTYILDYIDNTDNDKVQSYQYSGEYLDANITVSNQDSRVWAGFLAAIAETKDGLPCVAFARTNDDGDRPFGLYFDRESEFLSTSENSIKDLQYFPNPTKGELTVKAFQNIEKIEFYTITGNKIKEFSPNLIETNINLSDLPSGLYLMTVQSNYKKETFKIIKN